MPCYIWPNLLLQLSARDGLPHQKVICLPTNDHDLEQSNGQWLVKACRQPFFQKGPIVHESLIELQEIMHKSYEVNS